MYVIVLAYWVYVHITIVWQKPVTIATSRSDGGTCLCTGSDRLAGAGDDRHEQVRRWNLLEQVRGWNLLRYQSRRVAQGTVQRRVTLGSL